MEMTSKGTNKSNRPKSRPPKAGVTKKAGRKYGCGGKIKK